MEEQLAELRGALNLLMREREASNQGGFEAREAREAREREMGSRKDREDNEAVEAREAESEFWEEAETSACQYDTGKSLERVLGENSRDLGDTEENVRDLENSRALCDLEVNRDAQDLRDTGEYLGGLRDTGEYLGGLRDTGEYLGFPEPKRSGDQNVRDVTEDLEIRISGDFEIKIQGKLEIRGSNRREIKRSRDRETRRSGDWGTWRSGEQEILG